MSKKSKRLRNHLIKGIENIRSRRYETEKESPSDVHYHSCFNCRNHQIVSMFRKQLWHFCKKYSALMDRIGIDTVATFVENHKCYEVKDEVQAKS